MEEYTNRLRLENYRLTCESVCEMKNDPDAPLQNNPQRLFGYAHFADIFRGLIPLADYDEKGNFSYLDDFAEIFPDGSPLMQKTSAAVLFTGEPGCGKHTADYTFMRVAYSFVENEAIQAMREEGVFSIPTPSDLEEGMEYYRIDASAYDAFSERQLGEIMDSLFARMRERALANPAVLFYFSLGDVTRFFTGKRLAQGFVDKVRLLTEDPRARCIVTCIYTGRAAELPPALKSPFYVLELTVPEAAVRLEYFRFLTDYSPSSRFGEGAEALTLLTEGFTFGEIKRLVGYMLMSAKAALKKQRLKMSDVRLGLLSGEDRIVLNDEKIRVFADMIVQTRFVAAPAVTVGAPVYAPVSTFADQPPQDMPAATRSVQVQPQPQTKTAKDSAAEGDLTVEQEAARAVEEIDRPSQLRSVIDGLLLPAGYQPEFLMKNHVFNSSIFHIYLSDIDSLFGRFIETGLLNLSNLKSIEVSPGGNVKLRVQDKSLLNTTATGSDYDYKVVIREGAVLDDSLQRMGKDRGWLAAQLRRNNCQSVQEVFIGACGDNDDLIVFYKK